MVCLSCRSDNQAEFPAEMSIIEQFVLFPQGKVFVECRLPMAVGFLCIGLCGSLFLEVSLEMIEKIL